MGFVKFRIKKDLKVHLSFFKNGISRNFGGDVPTAGFFYLLTLL